MLDAPLTAGFTLRSNWLCWILDILKKEYYPYYIQHRASRIEYLSLYCSSINVNDIFIFSSGLSWLGVKIHEAVSGMKEVSASFRLLRKLIYQILFNNFSGFFRGVFTWWFYGRNGLRCFLRYFSGQLQSFIKFF